MLTSALAFVASGVLRRRFHSLMQDQRDPLAAQRRAFSRLRAHLAGTEVSRWSGLGDAADLESYCRTVPPRGYEAFADLTARAVDQGQRDVLSPGRPAFIGLSSGTSGQAPKRVVHTERSLRSFRDFEASLGAIIEHHAGINPVVSDRLVWGAAPANVPRAAAIETGYISGYLATRPRRLLRDRTVPSAPVGALVDMAQKIHQTGLQARGRDLRMASAVPTYLIHLLEELRAAWGVADFSAIWPRLDLILYSGTPIDCYREQIQRLLGRPVRFLGMYLATECPIGYEVPALAPQQHGAYAFHLDQTVFTFTRLGGDGRVLSVADLVAGDEVELLLSAPHGLLNYRVGDCLKIRSTAPLLFEVIGRLGQGMNVAAEKVPLVQLAQAVAQVGAAAATPIRHFFVCPGRSASDRPCYEWTLLCEQPAALDADALATALDRALMKENEDYRETREDLRFLDAPRVHLLDAAVARRYFERDAHRGQLKMKTAFDSREALDAFLRELGTAPLPAEGG